MNIVPDFLIFFIKTFLLFEKVFWLCCCCCSLTSFQEKEFFCQHKMDEWTKNDNIFTFFYNPKWCKDIWQKDTSSLFDSTLLHTHRHTHTDFPSLTHIHSLFLSLTHTNSLLLSLTLTLSPYLSKTHTLSLSL